MSKSRLSPEQVGRGLGQVFCNLIGNAACLVGDAGLLSLSGRQFFSNALSVLPFAGCTPVLRYLQIGHSKVSFVLPAKRKKWHGSFRGAVRILRLAFREKEGRRREIRIRLFGRFPAVPVDGVSGILMPLTGKVCQCFTEDFRILQPGFLPLTIAEQQVGSRKGLGQQGGLLFYNSFFPLLPTGSELLLTSHFLTGGLAICKFFMELEQLLLQTGKMAGMSDIGFFLFDKPCN